MWECLFRNVACRLVKEFPTKIFPVNLVKFSGKKHLFCRTPPVAASEFVKKYYEGLQENKTFSSKLDFLSIEIRCIFRALSNIFCGVFLRKS